MSNLQRIDPDVYQAIRNELKRKQENLELIASENIVSEAVLEAQGSIMTNKYAEGYPGARYYGGCEYVDVVEQLAIDRAKKIFGAEHVNVQPHSGSQANMAVYLAALNYGDTVMGMDLACGGHLTPGVKINFSGISYKFISYGVDKKTEMIDYAEVERLAKEHKPKMIIAGASAYSRIIDFKKFREICDAVGAYLFVDMAHIAGLVAAGLHPSPVPHAHFVTTTTHKTLRGPRAGMILCKAEFAKKIDSAVFPGIQGGPLMHIIAAKAVAFKEALTPEFKQYQKQVVLNARALAGALAQRGFRIVTGSTDNHLMLVDLTKKDITGKEAEDALVKAGITVNKNTIPFETRSPFVTSGIRIGTPAATTKGMKEAEMRIIAGFIDEAMKNRNDEAKLSSIKAKVAELCRRFPFYKNRL